MDKENKIGQEFNDLLFGVCRSTRYHSRRVKFFQCCHSAVLFLALVLSSATAASIAKEMTAWVPTIMSFVVTLATSLSLVFRFNDKAWEHRDFIRRFTELEIQLTSADEPDEALVKSVTNKRLEIEAEEPSVLRVLDTMIHNELARAMGYPEEAQYNVGFWQRVCAPFFSLCEHKIQKKKLVLWFNIRYPKIVAYNI